MIDRDLNQTTRRRGTLLKFIRQTHEDQGDRLNDLAIWGFMQDMGSTMSQRQVVTMLQDLQVLGLISFEQSWSEERERYVIEKVMLTAAGLGITTRRRNTDEVRFD